MRNAIIALAVASSVVALPAAAKPKVQKIEGTTWSIHVETGEKTDARGEKSFEEVLSFGANQVALEECGRRGYAPSTFTARKDGDKWEIEFTQTSPADGTMQWKADVREDWFKGVMMWTKRNGTERNFWFKGQLVKEDRKKRN